MHMKLVVLTLIVFFVSLALWIWWPTAALSPGTTADRILVEKSKRELTLFAGATILKRYRISLGRVPIGAKEKEGDKKTPEGIYTVIEHKSDSAFHLALRLSYPNESDVQRAKAQGVNAGFDIMVHGLPNELGFIGRLHQLRDWTAGCIAVTNSEIEEIYAVVPNGTTVEIKK